MSYYPPDDTSKWKDFFLGLSSLALTSVATSAILGTILWAAMSYFGFDFTGWWGWFFASLSLVFLRQLLWEGFIVRFNW